MNTLETTMKLSRTTALMTVVRACVLLGALVSTTAHAESPDAVPPGDSAAAPAVADSSAPDQASASQASNSPAPAHDPDWQVTTTSYVWLAGGHGDLSAFGYNSGWKVSPSDLLKKADFGIMQLVGLRYKRLVVLNDFYWAPFTIDGNKAKTFSQIPGQVAIGGQLKYTQIMLAPEAGYRIVDHPKLKIDALTGYRYWYNGVSLNVTSAVTLNQTTTLRAAHFHASNSFADPIVGGRIQFPLAEKLVANIWGDVGGWGAGAQLDYQMAAALTYRIKPKWGIDVGWRLLYYDYGTVIHNTNTFAGIAIGISHFWCCAE